MKLESQFLYRAFSKLAREVRPKPKQSTSHEDRPSGFFSPHLRLIDKSSVQEFITQYRQTHQTNGALHFLDVGGRHGEYRKFAEGYTYSILEIDLNATSPEIKHGDICSCPQIPSNTYDVVFSNNVFEHLQEPWNAALESVRICKPGGLLICMAPFSWRYHPVPVDNFRFSHSGLAYLFERSGTVETLLAGYDLHNRRRDHRGGKVAGGLDVPPVDELGGWREHWLAIYVGRKRNHS